jgi:hypothetical protein
MKQINYHKHYPIGMIKGNKNQVFTKRGTELTIKVSQKDNSRYIVLNRSFNKVKFLNVDRLYLDLFDKKKSDVKNTTTSVQTVFSKGDLKQQNRKGVYVPKKNTSPIISLSAYILKGSDKGKKLSELSLDRLNWYSQTFSVDMNCNELLELNTEISKRLK